MIKKVDLQFSSHMIVDWTWVQLLNAIKNL